MNNITAIIIDDEKMARSLLAGMLAEYCPNVAILADCADLPSGVKAIRKLRPNIVFLDIEMPGHSGLELLDFFDEADVNFSIIFTTAYNQYAVQAFKLSAVDYLLKPIEPAELQQAIERFQRNNGRKDYSILRDNTNPNIPQKLAVYSLNSVKFIETQHILYLHAEGAYTEIVLTDGKTITASKGLKKFEDILQENPHFFRCHKSYIINTQFITEHVRTDGGYLLLNHKHQISLSAERSAELYQLMGWAR